MNTIWCICVIRCLKGWCYYVIDLQNCHLSTAYWNDVCLRLIHLDDNQKVPKQMAGQNIWYFNSNNNSQHGCMLLHLQWALEKLVVVLALQSKSPALRLQTEWPVQVDISFPFECCSDCLCSTWKLLDQRRGMPEQICVCDKSSSSNISWAQQLCYWFATCPAAQPSRVTYCVHIT